MSTTISTTYGSITFTYNSSSGAPSTTSVAATQEYVEESINAYVNSLAPGPTGATGATGPTGPPITTIVSNWVPLGITLNNPGTAVVLGNNGTIAAMTLGNVSTGSTSVGIYNLNGSTWTQSATISPTSPYNISGFNTLGFGTSLAMSNYGNVIAIGSTYNQNGITSNAVFVYYYSGGVWALAGPLISSYGAAYYQFGYSVSLTANGTILAVGAPGVSITSDGTTYTNAGTVNIYQWSNGTTFSSGSWTPQSGNISLTDYNTFSGTSVCLNNIGNSVMLGAPGVSGNAGSIGVFSSEGDQTWSTYGVYNGLIYGAYFGASLVMSGNNEIWAIGAPNQAVNSSSNAGMVYIYGSTGNLDLSLSNGIANSSFGYSLALNADGSVLVIGAPGRDASSQGAILNTTSPGIVYIYKTYGKGWYQLGSTITGPTSSPQFGTSVAISDDGLVVCAGDGLQYVSLYKYQEILVSN